MTSFLTNFFKLALLPAESFSLAVEVVVAYEEGELSPLLKPISAKGEK